LPEEAPTANDFIASPVKGAGMKAKREFRLTEF
jgi:hypothetical protein